MPIPPPYHEYVTDFVRSERVRDFQPPWRTVYVYACRACDREVRVRVSGSGIGRGGIRCACGGTIRL